MVAAVQWLSTALAPGQNIVYNNGFCSQPESFESL